VIARLHPADLEGLADLIADRVSERLRDAPAPALVDAAAVARALGVSRDTVYANADRLGARRLGDGPRGRLRFVLSEAVEAWTARRDGKGSDAPKPAPRRAPRRSVPRPVAAGSPLLPIRPPGAAARSPR
jgi:hypothetical protein